MKLFNRTNFKNVVKQTGILWKDSPAFVVLNLIQVPLSVAVSVLGTYFPAVMVGDISEKKGFSGLILDIGILGGATVLMMLVNYLISMKLSKLSSKLKYGNFEKLSEKALTAGYEKIENDEFYDELQNQFEIEYQNTFTNKIMSTLTALLGAVIGMITYTGMLSGLTKWMILVVVFGAVVNYLVQLRCNKWDADNRDKWLTIDNKTAYLSREFSLYENAKDVRLFNMAPFLGKENRKLVMQRLKLTGRMQLNYWFGSATDALMALLREGMAYVYLIIMICDGKINAAQFVLYIGIVRGFASWCRQIVDNMKNVNEISSYIDRRVKFDSALAINEDDGEELELEIDKPPVIEFKDVSFKYPSAEKDTLNNINLVMKAGENLAMVGLNGAGKTTFVKLLCGLYKPTKGKILINGEDSRKYSDRSIQKYFSAVFQDVLFFPTSVKENITMGAPYDADRMESCLKGSDMKEKLESLPNGIESLMVRDVYKEAVQFSGGEEQRILLARALYKEAPMMILDEPTAALDPITESELYGKYSEFSKGKTTVFISHRLASTRFCDRIIYMENGSVAEIGSHDELMKLNGKYAELFETQSHYYKDEEKGEEE